MADTIFFPAPGAPLPTADTVVAGRSGGIPADAVTPWPNGILCEPAPEPLPPAPEGVVFFRTINVGQGAAYLGLGTEGAPANIPPTGREGPIRTVLLETPQVQIIKTARDRVAESAAASAASAAPVPPATLFDDVLASIEQIQPEAIVALKGGQ